MGTLSESNTDATKFLRPTHATVSRAALQHNLQVLQRELPANTKVLAMVKADAYGHGAAHIAPWLVEMGVAALGVATVEEGVALRAAGMTQPIIIMGGFLGAGERAAKVCLAHQLTPVIHSTDGLDFISKLTSTGPVTAHLKIDTGMGRLGVRPEALPQVLAAWKKSGVMLGGVMTHFANAGTPQVLSEQLQVWDKCVKEVRAQLGAIPWIHVANSAAILRHVVPQLETGESLYVRPGIALYGSSSYADDLRQHPLQTVMSVKSQVVLTKQAPAGTPVSYMGTYRLPKEGRTAVVPMGYADGYPWSAQGKAEVLVRGRRVPVAGRITMDMMMLDISDHPDVTVGDEVVLVGTQGSAVITADDVAAWAGTISYEIMCRVSPRVPRLYME
jgi:alanine racemase